MSREGTLKSDHGLAGSPCGSLDERNDGQENTQGELPDESPMVQPLFDVINDHCPQGQEVD